MAKVSNEKIPVITTDFTGLYPSCTRYMHETDASLANSFKSTRFLLHIVQYIAHTCNQLMRHVQELSTEKCMHDLYA